MGLDVSRDLIFWESFFPSQLPGGFLLASVFDEISFHTKKNQHHTQYLLLQSIINPPPPPPQVHHDLTCCQNYKGYGGEEADQDKDWGWVFCKVKGWRDVG